MSSRVSRVAAVVAAASRTFQLGPMDTVTLDLGTPIPAGSEPRIFPARGGVEITAWSVRRVTLHNPTEETRIATLVFADEQLLGLEQVAKGVGRFIRARRKGR